MERYRFSLDFRPKTYWPEGARRDEVVIATIDLPKAASLGPGVIYEGGQTIHIVARKRRRQIHYKIIDEYESKHKFEPTMSTRPLSMRELVGLIDSVETWEGSRGLTNSIRDMNLDSGEGEPTEFVDFVVVHSEFYPNLRQYYTKEALDWLKRAHAERAAEDEQGARFIRFLYYNPDRASAWRDCSNPELMLMMLEKFQPEKWKRELRLFACWCARRALALDKEATTLATVTALCREAIQIAERLEVGKASRDEFERAKEQVVKAAPSSPRSYMEAMTRQGTLWDPARAVVSLGRERSVDAARDAVSIANNIVWSQNAWVVVEEKVGDTISKVNEQTRESQEKAKRAVRITERAQAKKLRRLILNPFA